MASSVGDIVRTSDIKTRKQILLRLYHGIRLTNALKGRHTKYVELAKKWPENDAYNLALLIRVFTWNSSAKSVFKDNNDDKVRELRDWFMSSLNCSVEEKKNCENMMTSLKNDMAFAVWLQNLTGASLSAVPKYPLQVFGLFHSFAAEMNSRLNDASFGDNAFKSMKHALLAEHFNYKAVCCTHPDVKNLHDPYRFSLAFILRTSLPDGHPLHLKENEFTEFLSYVKKVYDIGSVSPLTTSYVKHQIGGFVTSWDDRHKSYCTDAEVWPDCFSSALPSALAQGFSTIGWWNPKPIKTEAAVANLMQNMFDGGIVTSTLQDIVDNGLQLGEQQTFADFTSQQLSESNVLSTPGYTVNSQDLNGISDSSSSDSEEESRPPSPMSPSRTNGKSRSPSRSPSRSRSRSRSKSPSKSRSRSRSKSSVRSRSRSSLRSRSVSRSPSPPSRSLSPERSLCPEAIKSKSPKKKKTVKSKEYVSCLESDGELSVKQTESEEEKRKRENLEKKQRQKERKEAEALRKLEEELYEEKKKAKRERKEQNKKDKELKRQQSAASLESDSSSKRKRKSSSTSEGEPSAPKQFALDDNNIPSTSKQSTSVDCDDSSPNRTAFLAELERLKQTIYTVKETLYKTEEFKRATIEVVKGMGLGSNYSPSAGAVTDALLMPPPPPSALPQIKLPSSKGKEVGAVEFLRENFWFKVKQIPHNGKQLPVPDLSNDAAFGHLPAYLLLEEGNPAVDNLGLQAISALDFRYLLRWGANWDEEANEKLKSCLNLRDDEIDVKHYMNDTIVKIYNKLSTSIEDNKVSNLTELIIFRLLSQIKEMSSGSFSQIRHNLGYRKQKESIGDLKETMTERLCCVACQNARVQYGWYNKTQEKLVLKFCSHCYDKEKAECVALCLNDPAMKANGCDITKESDLDKYFILVSYGGKKLSIKKGVEMIKKNITPVCKTPARPPSFDNYPVDTNVDETSALNSRVHSHRKQVNETEPSTVELSDNEDDK